ncbi:MAG: PRC-barrel domain-containing protein [Methanobrevibacter sp.]|nr:PRC-barrel domain-containing protein [Methanobrevibacter sp.]
MRAKQFFGITVLDKKVNEVGKVEDVDIDTETGNITTLIVSLQKGILSNDLIEIGYDKIATIGDCILLNTEISKEEEKEEADEEDSKQVTIEVEDE